MFVCSVPDCLFSLKICQTLFSSEGVIFHSSGHNGIPICLSIKFVKQLILGNERTNENKLLKLLSFRDAIFRSVTLAIHPPTILITKYEFEIGMVSKSASKMEENGKMLG